jgi:hypothetical protein
MNGEIDDDEGGPQGMMIDKDKMKDAIRQNMMKEPYDVCSFYKNTGRCQKIARSSVFENTTLAVIAFNALWMWVDTDLNNAASLFDAHPVFQSAEHLFCAYFSWEWAMRFGAFKRKRDGLRDAWFCFDSFMVVMMVGETWVLTAMLLIAGGGGGSGGMGNASILRLLRLLRLSRMARMAKLLRSMPELLILVKGMVSAMRSVFFTLLLLLICIYVFAIAFRQLLDGTPAGAQYFPSIMIGMHTLFLDGTLMDGTGNVVKAMLAQSWVYVVFFYLFLVLAAMMVMNMLIGVLCEVVSAVASTEREEISVSIVREGILEIIQSGGIDTNGDGKISKTEFESIMDDPAATRLLSKVDVDVMGLVDLADFIFAQDEDEEEAKELSFEEFMCYILDLRGSNQATVRDVVELRKYIKNSVAELEAKLMNPGRKSRKSSKQSIANASVCMPRGCSPLSGCSSFTSHAFDMQPSSPSSPCPQTSSQLFASAPGLGPPPVRVPANGSTGSFLTGVTPLRHESLWMHSARLEGVLNGARRELDSFIDTVLAAEASLCEEGSEPRRPSHPGVFASDEQPESSKRSPPRRSNTNESLSTMSGSRENQGSGGDKTREQSFITGPLTSLDGSADADQGDAGCTGGSLPGSIGDGAGGTGGSERGGRHSFRDDLVSLRNRLTQLSQDVCEASQGLQRLRDLS